MSEIRGAFQKSSDYLYDYGSQNLGKISFTDQLPVLCLALGNADHALFVHYLNSRLTMGPIEQDGGEVVEIGYEVDGRRWVWNSLEFWRMKVVPHTSHSTIKRIFKALSSKGVLLLRDDLGRRYLNTEHNPNLERINFVSLDYEILDALLDSAKAQYKVQSRDYLASFSKKRNTKKGASKRGQSEPASINEGSKGAGETYTQPSQSEPTHSVQYEPSQTVQNDTQSKPQELHSNSNLNINNKARFYENLALDGFLPDHWILFLNDYLPARSRNAFLKICENKITDNTDLIYLAYPKKKDKCRVDAALKKLPKSKRPHTGYIIDDLIFKTCIPEVLKVLDTIKRPLGIESFYPAHCDPVRYVSNQRWDNTFCDAEWMADYLNRAWNGKFHSEFESDDLSGALDLPEDEIAHLLAFVLIDLRKNPIEMIKPPENWAHDAAEKWQQQSASNLEQAVLLDRLQVLICRYKRELGHKNTCSPIKAFLSPKSLESF